MQFGLEVPDTAATRHVAPVIEKPGDRIGHYKLLQQIGEGGCGVVYMAEQEEPVRRRVALKIIKLGMDTRQVIARFEAERQALAMMDHPNIAKVFDAGSTERPLTPSLSPAGVEGDRRAGEGAAASHPLPSYGRGAGGEGRSYFSAGRPYFVMELVRGVKITTYCDEQKLSTRERLELFIQVCQAIQHAHQKGVIHRDIKPSNILVTEQDGAPVPKIIDFGIAKATTNQPLTDKTLFTAFEQFIGTPAYMSPEQAGLGGLDVDTRSDIYSLGVLLYELLAGQPPFDPAVLHRSALDEILRIIREQEPPRPSARLTTLTEQELSTVAQRRQTESTKLPNLVRGDLDWIVMKALEKDRRRRYETANGLARDLQRFLDNDEVLARPPSNLYRFQKLVRRNKLAFAAASAVALALLLGLASSTWLLLKEGQARRRAVTAEQTQTHLRQEADSARQQAQAGEQKAKTQALKSEQVAGFLKDMLTGVGPSVALGRDTAMLKEILDKTADRFGKDLTNQPEVEIELRLTLGETYNDLGLYNQMEEMARRSLELARSRLGEEHPTVGLALGELSQARLAQGDFAQAEVLGRQALALQKKRLGNQDLATAGSLARLGNVLRHKGKLAEAESLQREALAVRRTLLGNDDPAVTSSLDDLASVLWEQGKLAEAEAIRRDVVEFDRKHFGKVHPDLASALNNLAIVLFDERKLAEAEAMFLESLEMKRRLLASDHPDLAKGRHNLADVLLEEGKFSEAEAMQREAILMQRKLFGSENPTLATFLNGLGLLLWKEGKLAEAEAAQREALVIRRKVLGNEHAYVGTSLANLALVLQDEGKLSEAEDAFREALALDKRMLPDGHLAIAVDLNNLARVLRDLGKLAEAEEMVREALARFQKLYGEEHPDVAWSLAILGNLLRNEGKLAEAETAGRQALKMRRKLLGNGNPDVGDSLKLLAGVLSDEGKLDEAEILAREDLALQRRLFDDHNPKVATSLANLARVLYRRDMFAEAALLVQECLQICEQKQPNDWQTFSAKSLLGGILLRQKKYVEAEQLLLSGYEGMKQRDGKIPFGGKRSFKETLDNLIQLHEEIGRPDRAAQWKQKLAEFEKAEAEQHGARP